MCVCARVCVVCVRKREREREREKKEKEEREERKKSRVVKMCQIRRANPLTTKNRWVGFKK